MNATFHGIKPMLKNLTLFLMKNVAILSVFMLQLVDSIVTIVQVCPVQGGLAPPNHHFTHWVQIDPSLSVAQSLPLSSLV